MEKERGEKGFVTAAVAVDVAADVAAADCHFIHRCRSSHHRHHCPGSRRRHCPIAIISPPSLPPQPPFLPPLPSSSSPPPALRGRCSCRWRQRRQRSPPPPPPTFTTNTTTAATSAATSAAAAASAVFDTGIGVVIAATSIIAEPDAPAACLLCR